MEWSHWLLSSTRKRSTACFNTQVWCFYTYYLNTCQNSINSVFFTVIISISYSEEENQWVVENLVKPTGIIGEAWLGLAELQSDNRFRWTDSSPIPYVNWDDNQPATNKGSMECVSMRMGKTWGYSLSMSIFWYGSLRLSRLLTHHSCYLHYYTSCLYCDVTCLYLISCFNSVFKINVVV